MAAARPRRAVSGGALIKAECMSLLPDVLRAIERVDSDQGDSVQMMKSLVEKVDRIEKRLNAINFAHEEVVDAMRQQGILADYASKLRQQRALVEEIVNLDVLQKLNTTSPAPSTSVSATAGDGTHGAAPAAAAPGKLVLRRGAVQSAGGASKRQRREPAGD